MNSDIQTIRRFLHEIEGGVYSHDDVRRLHLLATQLTNVIERHLRSLPLSGSGGGGDCAPVPAAVFDLTKVVGDVAGESGNGVRLSHRRSEHFEDEV